MSSAGGRDAPELAGGIADGPSGLAILSHQHGHHQKEGYDSCGQSRRRDHIFTEVAEFGGGFIPMLNNPPNAPAVPECAGGYANNTELASTRLI